MKYLVKLFVVTLLLLIYTHASAEQKVVYIDMKFILNNSQAGKGAQDFLQKTFNENQKKFSNQENELKKEENDLLSKKTIYTAEEYKQKSDELRKKVISYQSERRKSLEKITKQRADARQTLLKTLDPILDNYIKENNISVVIDKKNIIGGQTNLDITKIIVEKLNGKLPSLNLK
jgi:outer membrane protein